MAYSTDLARAIVRVEYLLASEPFQSTEETRYYLNGLFIQPHPRAGAKIVATNGHLLSVVYDHEAIVSGPPTIWSLPWKATMSGPIREVRKQYKACPALKLYADLQRGPGKNDTKVRLVGAESAAEVFNGFGFELMVKPGENWVDGTFPDYDRVIPRDLGMQSQGVPAAFNSRYVAQCAAFGQAMAEAADPSEKLGLMTLYCGPAEKAKNGCYSSGPAIFTFGPYPGFVVIMPVRDNYSPRDQALPDWYLDTGEEKARPEGKPDLKIAA